LAAGIATTVSVVATLVVVLAGVQTGIGFAVVTGVGLAVEVPGTAIAAIAAHIVFTNQPGFTRRRVAAGIADGREDLVGVRDCYLGIWGDLVLLVCEYKTPAKQEGDQE